VRCGTDPGQFDNAQPLERTAQEFVQWAGRFSANARAPSFASLEAKTGPMMSDCRLQTSSARQYRDSTSTRLVAAMARGPLAVISSASVRSRLLAPRQFRSAH
jgi:hypothetical protein